MVNKSKSSGFTLMELVMAITLVGIFAAIALPKFHRSDNDYAIAQKKISMWAASMSIGSQNNYMAKQAGAPAVLVFNRAQVCQANLFAQLLAPKAFPSSLYNMRATETGESDDCTTAQTAKCQLQSNGPPWVKAQVIVYCAR